MGLTKKIAKAIIKAKKMQVSIDNKNICKKEQKRQYDELYARMYREEHNLN